MAVSAYVYGCHLQGQYGTTSARRVDWDANTIRSTLHTSSYTPNKDTDDFFDDATNEITGTGYTAYGVNLTTSAVSLDSATHQVRLDANDAQWASAAFSAALAVQSKDAGGADSADPLICYLDFGGTESVSGPGTFTITWASEGIIVLDYA
jgi:hypothetical protein